MTATDAGRWYFLDIGSTRVNELRGVLRYHANLVLGHEFFDGHTCKGAIDMQTFGKDRRGD